MAWFNIACSRFIHTHTHTMLCVGVCVLWDRWWQTSPRSMRGVSLLAHVHSAHLIWFTNSLTWWHGVWAITNANAPRQCSKRDWSTMRTRHWLYKSKSASKSKASRMSTLCSMLVATIHKANLRKQCLLRKLQHKNPKGSNCRPAKNLATTRSAKLSDGDLRRSKIIFLFLIILSCLVVLYVLFL